jgi:hypothetical protein
LLGGLPLLCFTPSFRFLTSRWTLAFEVEGGVAALFDLTLQDSLPDARGQRMPQEAVGTAVLLPGLTRGPRFHCEPLPSAQAGPAVCWPDTTILTRRMELGGKDGRPGKLVCLEGEIPASWREVLAGLEDCLVAADRRAVLVLRYHPIRPEELPCFLTQVQELAQVLHALDNTHRPGGEWTTPRSEETEAIQPASRETIHRTAPAEAPLHTAALDSTDAEDPLGDAMIWLIRRYLPMPGPGLSLRGAFFILLAPGVLFVLVLSVLGVALPGLLPQSGVPELWISAVFCELLGVLVFVMALPHAWRARGMARSGAACGLRPGPRLADAELKALRTLPLFRFAERHRKAVSHWLLEGRVEGVRLRVFDFRSGHLFPWEQPLPRPGTLQTVALLDVPGLTVPFHCAPAPCVWDETSPGWAMGLGLLLERKLPDPDGTTCLVLRTGVDGVIEGALPPRLDAELPRLGRLVEGAPGVVAIYRHDRVVSPDELPLLVEAARRVAVAIGTALPAPERTDLPQSEGS